MIYASLVWTKSDRSRLTPRMQSTIPLLLTSVYPG